MKPRLCFFIGTFLIISALQADEPAGQRLSEEDRRKLENAGVALVKQIDLKSGDWRSVPKHSGDSAKPEFERKGFTEQEAIKFIRDLIPENETVPSALVLYVHGRGKEPTKSMQAGNLLAKIKPGKEEPVVSKLLQDSKKVVMFHWYRSAPGVSQYYPNVEAAAAAEGLGTLLNAWVKVKRQLSARYASMPCVLVCHSMGNIVFREMMQKNKYPRSSGAIDTFLCSSADVDAKNHEQWLGKAFTFCDQVIVTNKAGDDGDGILKHARGKNDGRARLGDVGRSKSLFRKSDEQAIHPTNRATEQLPLAEGVIYADFSLINFRGFEHRYIFTQSPDSVRGFFATALKGRDVMQHLQTGHVQVSQVQGATRLLFLP